MYKSLQPSAIKKEFLKSFAVSSSDVLKNVEERVEEF
jgi:hypothetical protein